MHRVHEVVSRVLSVTGIITLVLSITMVPLSSLHAQYGGGGTCLSLFCQSNCQRNGPLACMSLVPQDACSIHSHPNRCSGCMCPYIPPCDCQPQP